MIDKTLLILQGGYSTTLNDDTRNVAVVSLDPQSTGAREATLYVTSTDAAFTPMTIPLTAEVVAASDTQRHLAMVPANQLVNFDPQFVGQTREETITITNASAAGGTLELTLGLVNYDAFAVYVVSGGVASEIDYVNPTTYVLGPYQDLTLRVEFTPNALGEHVGALLLRHNDGDVMTPLRVALWGVGATGTPKRYYYFKDHLGSVRATVNEDGNVVDSRDYYPFGMQMAGRGATGGDEAPKERYTGHELDEETGLFYAGARYLDPVIGRWNGIDPLADKYPMLSPYTYAGNSPLFQYTTKNGSASERSYLER